MLEELFIKSRDFININNKEYKRYFKSLCMGVLEISCQFDKILSRTDVESHIANDILSGNRNRKKGVNKKPSKVQVMALFNLK